MAVGEEPTKDTKSRDICPNCFSKLDVTDPVCPECGFDTTAGQRVPPSEAEPES
jgi:predicted amidophosphoribosyltransferase